MNTILLSVILATSINSKCPDLYPNGDPFVVKNTVELCNSFFVTVYDPKLKANVFSAEKIDNIRDNPNRVNTFRSDKRVPANSRAELSDYRNSKYDRGHMVPSADSSNLKEMRDTFLLSNIVPQSSKLNRGQWSQLEEEIRDNSIGATYILTGAVYPKKPEFIGNGISVPYIMYKCIWWSPKDSQCFVSLNKDEAQIVPMKLKEVNKMTGLKLR